MAIYRSFFFVFWNCSHQSVSFSLIFTLQQSWWLKRFAMLPNIMEFYSTIRLFMLCEIDRIEWMLCVEHFQCERWNHFKHINFLFLSAILWTKQFDNQAIIFNFFSFSFFFLLHWTLHTFNIVVCVYTSLFLIYLNKNSFSLLLPI